MKRVVLVIALLVLAAATAVSANAANNPIVTENALPGTSNWKLTLPAYGGEIEGYAGATSVNKGGTITLYINSQGATFTLDIYRLGWYQGLGGRLVSSTGTHAATSQPACAQDTTYGLIECKWAATTSITSATTWTSGVYVAKVRRTDTGADNYITFIVRDDASTSNILFDSNVNTMQAYNNWGGKSLYAGDSAAPRPAKSISNAAVKVSFDRPYKAFDYTSTTDCCEDTQVLRWEYQMIRWLESQGFDVSYTTNIDVGLNAAVLLQHRVYLTAGHGEYWTSSQRNNVELALSSGVNLAFFTANSSYWQVRFEASSSGVPNRVMVGYKESAPTYDPLLNDSSQSTTRFRDSWINRPENRLLGAMYGDFTNCCTGFPLVVSDSSHPFYRNTGVANGTSFPGLVGDEFDNVEGTPTSNNPANLVGLMVLSNSPTTGSQGTSHATAVVHQTAAGALVFDAATFQWSWGLDNTLTPFDRVDSRIGQITANILTDMGAVALTPSGISVTTTFSISGKVAGASSATIRLTGDADRVTATDPSGNYIFKLVPSGQYVVRPDTNTNPTSQNVSVSSSSVTGVNFTVACPCTIWSASAVPVVASDLEAASVEVGVKFRADSNGLITGIRYYKSGANTGAHVGHLWTATGTLIATVNFTSETASGWQQANFSTPVQITANTVYVASYHTNSGHYAADAGYFSNSGVDTGPLHALRDGVNGPNGVGIGGPSGTFPTGGFQASNYWVDVVYIASADNTAPTLTSHSPASNATGVPTNTTVSATFSEPVEQSSIAFTLKDSSNNAVPAAFSYDSGTFTAKLTPNAALGAQKLYTATVSGAKDSAGNTMATVSWSFTTGSGSVSCPCTIWPDTAVPTVASDPEAASVEVGVKFRADSNGVITGIRYYKSAANTGTHVGHLWTSDGNLLATVTFTNETTSGWQQANFSTPVPINANTVYVASYHTNTGHYAGDVGYFSANGVDNGPLHALRDGDTGPNGVGVGGPSGTFPSSGYQSSNYWVDVVYTPLVGCPCTIWPATAAPTVAGDPESASVEVGVKFRADTNGRITGIRYYKSTANTGTHVAHLWTAAGALLGTVTFVNETPSGWQQANFTSPISITAGQVYVASYHTDVGHYADDIGYFAAAGFDSGPLHALRDGVSGPNGVGIGGPSGTFPNQGYQASNYWVDLVFISP